MHSKDARAAGETEQRLYALNAWRETPFYSARERAALAWTEALTQIAQDEVSDALYAEARKPFNDKELVDLSLAIIAINGWNRLAIPFRSTPGHLPAQGQRYPGLKRPACYMIPTTARHAPARAPAGRNAA